MGVGSVHKEGTQYVTGVLPLFHLSQALISKISLVTFLAPGRIQLSALCLWRLRQQNQTRKYAGVVTSNTSAERPLFSVPTLPFDNIDLHFTSVSQLKVEGPYSPTFICTTQNQAVGWRQQKQWVVDVL